MISPKESAAVLAKVDKALAPDPFAVGESDPGFGLIGELVGELAVDCPRCRADFCWSCQEHVEPADEYRVSYPLEGDMYSVFDRYGGSPTNIPGFVADTVRFSDSQALLRQECYWREDQ